VFGLVVDMLKLSS